MWFGWPLERMILFFVGIAFAIIFVQVTLFHSRQNFRHWTMWIPVIGTPLFAINAVVLSFYQVDWLRWLFTFFMLDGIAAGLYGAYLHTVGVGQRVGGYSQSQNYLVGPPIVLPLMITVLSALGLVALYGG